MRVVTLGTGGAIPMFHRNLPSTAIKRGGELFLFDCGEGTQMQLRKAKFGYKKLKAIFISHLHGDHITGLPGLLMTLTHLSRTEPLCLVGPPGTKKYLNAIRECLEFNPNYEIIAKDTKGGEVYRQPKYRIKAFPINHTIFTLAYSLEEENRPGRFSVNKALSLGVPEGPLFGKLQSGESVTLEDNRVVLPEEVLGPQRKGRKIIHALDTRPCESVKEEAREADLLIHDGMFGKQMEEEAKAKGHSTVVQAAKLAKRAGVKRLVLTHISPRYHQDNPLVEEASKVFPQVTVARDLAQIEVPLHK